MNKQQNNSAFRIPHSEFHHEGDLYKVVEIEGRTFEIRYGYYDPELERGHIEPMPIFPNFLKEPLYTADGYPFVTGDQEICKHFSPKPKISGEGWCNDCEHFEKHEEFLGVCRCEVRRKNDGNAGDKLIANPDENNYSLNQTTIKEAK